MRGNVWADPDLAQAARFMREVALDRGGALEKGRVARRDMLRDRVPETTGVRVRERLEAIRGHGGHGMHGIQG
jgi:hypothetical protein